MSAVERNTLYCSFCGKSQHEVGRLVAGPTVFICDDCAVLCVDIVWEPLLKSGGALSAAELEKATLFRANVQTHLERWRGLLANAPAITLAPEAPQPAENGT